MHRESAHDRILLPKPSEASFYLNVWTADFRHVDFRERNPRYQRHRGNNTLIPGALENELPRDRAIGYHICERWLASLRE